ncbi:MAG: diadenylate cyclase CdaA [Clostridium sp.]|nr:diadenylate cyclase CdaA [Clostridium sp.]
MEKWLGEALQWLRTYTASIDFGDAVEILIVAFLVYHVLVWIKASRAWSLLKGLTVIGIFLLIAIYFQMHTVLWLASNVLGFAVTALIVVLQPELRRALDELGKKNIISSMLPIGVGKKDELLFTDKTIQEIIRACVEMTKTRTGALIVIANTDSLSDFERTGIEVDALVTSQLLINIFEHNTPLHDGAVIIQGNRIVAATCYLPLSDSRSLSKDLGTRHRAAVGISEVTDSLTIVVSEESGKISLAAEGALERGVDAQLLRERLEFIQKKGKEDADKKTIRRWVKKRKSK